MSKTFIESLVGKRVRFAGNTAFIEYGWMRVAEVIEGKEGNFAVYFDRAGLAVGCCADGKQARQTDSAYDLLVHPDDADKPDDLGALTDEEAELIRQHREANKPPATRVVELYTDGEGREFNEGNLLDFLFGRPKHDISRNWMHIPYNGMRRKVRVTVEHLEYVEETE